MNINIMPARFSGRSKIKKNFFSFLIGLLSVSMAACSDDSLSENTGNGGAEGSLSDVKITFNIDMPRTRGTRSGTGDDGGSYDENGNQLFEPGQSGENNIGGFQLAFFIEENSEWKHIAVSYKTTVSGNKVTAEISFEDMKKLVDHMVRIRLVGNCTADPAEDASIIPMGVNMEDVPLGKFMSGGLSVPLANYEEYNVDFTSLTAASESELIQKITALLDADRYLDLSETNYVNGDLQLERCVARFDYKPYGWTKTANTANLNRHTYQVGEINNLYAQMYSVQVLNVSKNVYLFRHTSQGNRQEGRRPDGEGDRIFGIENSNSNFEPSFDSDLNGDIDIPDTDPSHYEWIQDTDWDYKDKFFKDSSTSNWAGPFLTSEPYFLNQPTKNSDEPIYYVHPSGTNNYGLTNVYYLEDQGEQEGFRNHYKSLAVDDHYLPLFYMSENTVPSTNAMINGLTTGVEFKMVLTDKNGNLLKPTDFLNEDTYKNTLKQLEELDAKKTLTPEEEAEKQRLLAALESYEGLVVGSLTKDASYNSGSQDKWYKLTIGSQSVYAEKITVKDSQGRDTDAYAVCYYYYFKHNYPKDHQLGTVEPMLYAVVRNNIYKVCVTALNGLPDPYNPGKHDEPKENVIAVETAILSWARVDKNVDIR